MGATRDAIEAVIYADQGLRPVTDDDAAAFNAIPLALDDAAFRAAVVAVLVERFGVGGPGFRVRRVVDCLREAA